MIIRCLDLETTGMNLSEEDRPKHAIVEIGYCDLDTETGAISPPIGALVNPGRAISIEARAVHHLSDADVADGISPTDASMQLMRGRNAYFSAHNIDFERQFFGGGEVPWICTYKCGLRVWEKSPGHRLQELRYFLEVDAEPDFDPSFSKEPHRAASDAYIGAHVLRRLLRDAGVPVDKLAHWSSGPALLSICWLKAHKGKIWKDVPVSYLDWIVNKSDISDRDIRATAKFYYAQKTKT